MLCGHMKVQLNKELCCSFLYELTPFFFLEGDGRGREMQITSLLIFEVCIRSGV